MKLFSIRIFYWRLYVVAALIAAGILAPLIFAPVPWLMLLAYIYLIFHPQSEDRFGVPFNILLALSLPLLFEPVAGWLSPLFALPVLPLLDNSLRKFAAGYELKAVEISPSSHLPSPLRGEGEGEGENDQEATVVRVRPTNMALSLALSLGIVIIIALVLSSWVLLLSASLGAAYLAVVAGTSLYRNKRTVSITAELTRQRIVAGHTGTAPVKILPQGEGKPLEGFLYLNSPLLWFSVKPVLLAPSHIEGSLSKDVEGSARVACGKKIIELQASFTPPLAGPVLIALDAAYIDPRGLTRLDFTLDVMEFLIIPRARYAEWMARKYLEMSRGGGLEIANPVSSSSRRASRRGIEFYGLRPYQPGDAARSIDWKHTSKLHQVIVKEFMDKNTECAVVAVNLSVGSEEEKDKLVSDLITTALTLARENIPSGAAAYNERGVVKTTPLLDPQQALVQALSLTKEVTIGANLRRYLTVPDAKRIRSNLMRLKASGSGAAERLAELLRLEYAALEEQARQSPATAALAGTLAGMKTRANIIVVSARNHDAAALAFNRQALEQRGYRFIDA